jgi:hypothetical protein
MERIYNVNFESLSKNIENIEASFVTSLVAITIIWSFLFIFLK